MILVDCSHFETTDEHLRALFTGRQVCGKNKLSSTKKLEHRRWDYCVRRIRLRRKGGLFYLITASGQMSLYLSNNPAFNSEPNEPCFNCR